MEMNKNRKQSKEGGSGDHRGEFSGEGWKGDWLQEKGYHNKSFKKQLAKPEPGGTQKDKRGRGERNEKRRESTKIFGHKWSRWWGKFSIKKKRKKERANVG